MPHEELGAFRTRREAVNAIRRLTDAGIPRTHLQIAAARRFGHLHTSTFGASGALLGITCGALGGISVALVLLFVGKLALGPGLILVFGVIGAGVGAFVGGVSGLSYRQHDSIHVTEPLAEHGYIVRVVSNELDEERVAKRVLFDARAAMVTRERQPLEE